MKVRDGREPEDERKTSMSSQFITSNEIEDLNEQSLQSRYFDIMEVLRRTQNYQAERAFALASLETVQAELNRKRAVKLDGPRP
jgi:hypothetical protein